MYVHLSRHMSVTAILDGFPMRLLCIYLYVRKVSAQQKNVITAQIFIYFSQFGSLQTAEMYL